MKKVYMCIDLKTFFASVECSERKLDPFQTNLVVADPSRGKGALCLAITPKMKAIGIRNRCRIFEIPNNVEYITALPRMNLYMDYSARIYGIYLRYVSEKDIHVYSIDECFIDMTPYLKLYNKKPKEFAQMLMDAVMELYDRIVDKDLLIRRINITANKLVDEHTVTNDDAYEQLDFFTDYEAVKEQREKEEADLERERHMQEAMLSIKKKYGKNAVLRGMNFEEGATAKERNGQIGGHQA